MRPERSRPVGAIRRLKRAAHAVLAWFGYFLTIENGHYRLRRRVVLGAGDFLPVIRFAVPDPRTVFVLGAYEGLGAERIIKAFPRARVYAFEPDPDTYARMRANLSYYPTAVCVEMAVGAEMGTATLNRNKSADTNSLLATASTSDGMRTAGQVDVPVVTLDEYCRREGIETIDYIHADLQGFELSMLKGATGLLEQKRIKLILLEVCLDQLYSGQASFDELYAFLAKRGYRFVCTQGMFFDPGKLYPRGGNIIFVAP